MFKTGDAHLRPVNQNCSVESKYAQPASLVSIGSQVGVSANSYSIDMILNIDE
jgi:hypothetical protein